ncbi:Z-ring formation inhibitor MciZ [Mesobacillus jeotgali]|nr:Z-ring formation inhibitor MciZ [Mesobacillus jeotgali]UYZ20650.1 Z-ring formation inhibitor MciZ [Mesobacillus jeotgali]
MKIYVHSQGITLAGKAWEIQRTLKEYGKKHEFVKDWIETVNQPNRRPE